MRVLCLAPHPFFQERGTPIDVLLVLRVLSRRSETRVDALVFNEGSDVSLPNIHIHRIPDLRITRNVRPGFTAKKLVCDLLFFFKAWSLVQRNRYDLIHAGEEAVFAALFFKILYGIPYAYDLDSSIAQQLVERKRHLRWLSPLFERLEAQGIRHSLVNFPVCNALAELCERRGSRKTVTLHDISQLRDPDRPKTGWLGKQLGLPPTSLIALYSGNLEPYQGIDLLLESLKIAAPQDERLQLVIIGGIEADIKHYQAKARSLGIEARTHFLGPISFQDLDRYLAEADVLVCPRSQGINTPMKIFPYLHSGKPVLATAIASHTQILSENEAALAPPDPGAFAGALLKVASSQDLRRRLGRNGRALVERNHTFDHHQRRVNEAYDWLEERVMRTRDEAEFATRL